MADFPPDLLEAENLALRAELSQLRAAQAAKAAHQALADDYEQSQVRFRTVFENSPLGHKIIGPDLVIRQVNPALVAMLGCAGPAEVVGRRILDFTHPAHRQDWHLLQDRLWTHRTRSFVLETRLVRCDGSAFWCQVTSVQFRDGAEELGYTTLEDISDRKHLEESHKRLYDAQETILHLVAHDLRTPIAHIQMLAELLCREDLAAPESEAPRFLTLIEQACNEANKLLRDVLYLGQLDAAPLRKQPVDLNAFLEARLAPYHLAAREKNIALALELPPQRLQANHNPDQLGRVLANLLTNALKFTPAGGRVWVRLLEHEGRARLVVQDTGVGIPPELQGRVFDKFGSAARAGLYGESATGLGLFITRQIVQLYGGSIRLESHEGEGTTFFVDLG